MATYYVDSNATGLNDGSSWANAWTSIASASSAGSGDKVLVASTHSENFSGTTTINWSASDAKPVQIISANVSTNQQLAGATLTTDSKFIYSGSYDYYGMRFENGFGSHDVGTNGRKTSFTNCTFAGKSGGGAPFYSAGVQVYTQYFYAEVTFNQCTFDFTIAYNDGSRRITAHTGKLILNGCTIINPPSVNPLFLIHSWDAFAGLEVNNMDLSSISSSLFSIGKKNFSAKLRRCNLPSGYTIPSLSGSTGELLIQDCVIGTISSPPIVSERYVMQGSQLISLTKYRTNGANDGTSDYSLNLTTNTNAQEGSSSGALGSSVIEKYVESGSQTITVYVAGSASLNNDDFWIEVESPSEEVSPTAQGKFRTTKPDPLVTPTALTSDTSSAWNGTGVGTKQKVEVAISPTIAGTVTVRCYLAKPSTTVYVDPKISTTGNQRVFNGVLVDTDESLFSVAGGGSSSPTYTSTAGTQIYPFRTFAEDDFDKGGTKFHPLS